MLISLCVVLSLFTGTAHAASAAPDVSAKSMVVIHADSGMVLSEKNANTPMLIASTTKIMTALVALENLEPDREVVIDPAWTSVEGSSMYLRPGATYTVRELLSGLLLASGNDAALALACTAASTAEEFARQMNEKARELRLENTHFTNPHGLDEDDHYSSARDLAAIMAAAMDNDLFAEIVGTRSFSTHGATYVNHNKLLWRCKGVNGGKTGYTKAAGRCLVTCCEREGLKLICVTLSAADDWRDHSALYDWAYEAYEGFTIAKDTPLAAVPVVSGKRETVDAVPTEEISLCIPRGSQVEQELQLPRFVFAGIEQGARAGALLLRVDGESTGSWPLVWADKVLPAKGTPREFLNRWGKGILGTYYYG